MAPKNGGLMVNRSPNKPGSSNADFIKSVDKMSKVL
jgi:hypothetical protein